MLSATIKAIILIGLTGNTANAMSGQEIMQTVDKNNKNLKTMSSEVLMVIKGPNGTRERNFYHLKKYDKPLTKSLIKFYLPATVKGTSLLTHSEDGKEKNIQWVYLPALKSLNRISGDKEKDSFMGSDFTYSDVAGRQLNQDTHRLLKEDEKYYYIRSTPKRKEDLYSKINILVSKKAPIVLKAIFYDREGKKFKTLSNKKIKKIGPMYVVTKSIMKSHAINSSTTLDVSNIKKDISISDNDVGIKGIRK